MPVLGVSCIISEIYNKRHRNDVNETENCKLYQKTLDLISRFFES